MTLPAITEGQLRALRIAARHEPVRRTARKRRRPTHLRIEKDPLGKQYVTELENLGLLGQVWTGREYSREITPLAVDLLRAHWLGEWNTTPMEGTR